MGRQKHLLVEVIVVGLDKGSLRFLSPTVCVVIVFTFTTVKSSSWRAYTVPTGASASTCWLESRGLCTSEESIPVRNFACVVPRMAASAGWSASGRWPPGLSVNTGGVLLLREGSAFRQHVFCCFPCVCKSMQSRMPRFDEQSKLFSRSVGVHSTRVHSLLAIANCTSCGDLPTRAFWNEGRSLLHWYSSPSQSCRSYYGEVP